MILQRNAPAKRAGARTGRQTPRSGGDLVVHNSSTKSPRRQGGLSRLVDQALTLAEVHEGEAWRHWRLAARHRAIKRAIEGLAGVQNG